MDALNDLKNIINHTSNIIDCFNALTTPVSTQDELDNIEQLLNSRTEQLHRFFEHYSQQELEDLITPLNQLAQQDKELIQLASNIKQEMLQKVLKQKKTDKAHKFYKNI